MNIIQKLSSKNILIFNLVLIGVIFGFAMAFVPFSCTSPSRVQAQQSQVIIPEDALAVAESLQTVQRAVSEKVLPSVVELITFSVRRQSQNFNGIPWDFFFGPRDGDQNNQEREYRSQGLGSGIIVRYVNGVYYVLTNNHVVEDTTEIRVATIDGREYPGVLVGADSRKDLALVSFKTNDYYPLATLGNSDDVAVGDFAIAIGNPLGEQFSFSVTMGIVSALGRTGGPGGNINDFIQTDASINMGNSGGPLLNIRGEVIGINTWIASNAAGGGNVGLGFAIPINNAKRTIDEFIETGAISYGWLGVSLFEPTREIMAELGIEGRRGALAYNVFLGSPADNGGIRAGDFITHVNGREVRDVNQLMLIVGDLKPGDSAMFGIIRNGRVMELNVRIEARTDEAASDNKKLFPGVFPIPITDEIRRELQLGEDAKGLIAAQIIAGSPADISGLRYGDIIKAVNGQPIDTMLSFYEALRERALSELWFDIQRGESDLETLHFRR